MSHSQALRHDRIHGRVESHSDVRTWDFEVRTRLPRHAIAPVHNTVVTGVNGRLKHGTRDVATQRVDEIAGALSGVAAGKHGAAVFALNLQAYGICGLKHGAIGNGALNG